MRNDAAIPFDFHVQVVARQYLISQLKDFRKGAGGELVVRVVRHIRLEQAGVLTVMQLPAAIDELLGGVAHFRNVEMGGNRISAGQDESRMSFGVLREDHL